MMPGAFFFVNILYYPLADPGGHLFIPDPGDILRQLAYLDHPGFAFKAVALERMLIRGSNAQMGIALQVRESTVQIKIKKVDLAGLIRFNYALTGVIDTAVMINGRNYNKTLFPEKRQYFLVKFSHDLLILLPTAGNSAKGRGCCNMKKPGSSPVYRLKN
jgi:hypothetical protein